jgi:hypothetical protein
LFARSPRAVEAKPGLVRVDQLVKYPKRALHSTAKAT